MKTKLLLNEAIQIGPWRVARKHLLFVMLFGLAIIALGFIILQTHVFDSEDDEEEEGDDEGDDEWGDFGERFSGGDWVMIALMVAAGIISIGAILVCMLVKKNTPRRLSGSQRNASIYSVQFNSNSKPPVSTQSYAAPQQIPIWSGQIIQPTPQAQLQPQLHNNPQSQPVPQQILRIPQVIRQQPQIPRVVTGRGASGRHQTSSNDQPRQESKLVTNSKAASAPRYEVERPPPYSP